MHTCTECVCYGGSGGCGGVVALLNPHSLKQQNKYKGQINCVQTRCHFPAAASINPISMAIQSLSGQASRILLWLYDGELSSAETTNVDFMKKWASHWFSGHVSDLKDSLNKFGSWTNLLCRIHYFSSEVRLGLLVRGSFQDAHGY